MGVVGMTSPVQAINPVTGIAAEVPDFTAGIRVLARLARVAERACQEAGISLPQYRLLLSIADRSARASELAAHVGVSRPTLTSLVDGLEHNGLLRRVPVPSDRRGIRLEPTHEGLDALARAEGVITRRLLELVDPEVAGDVRAIVTAVGNALDREGALRAPGRSAGV